MKKWKLIAFTTRLVAHKWLSYKLSMFYSTIEYLSPSKVEHMRIKCKMKVAFYISKRCLKCDNFIFWDRETHRDRGREKEERGRDGEEWDWGLVYRIVACCVKGVEEYCKNDIIFISGIKI